MNAARPAVSVIVPVHNGARFLRHAIASVLAQSIPVLEIVVVDDGSTDATPELVRTLAGPIRYLRQEQRGPSAARNAGIRSARAPELLAFLDADDLWPTDKLVRQLPPLGDPEVDIVMGFTQPMLMTKPAEDVTALEPLLSPRLTLSVGASLFRRSAFERFGDFDETMRTAEDMDWLLRAREAGARIEVVDAVTLLYRENPDSLSYAKSPAELSFFSVLKRSLDRRRRERSALAPLRKGSGHAG